MVISDTMFGLIGESTDMTELAVFGPAPAGLGDFSEMAGGQMRGPRASPLIDGRQQGRVRPRGARRPLEQNCRCSPFRRHHMRLRAGAAARPELDHRSMPQKKVDEPPTPNDRPIQALRIAAGQVARSWTAGRRPLTRTPPPSGEVGETVRSEHRAGGSFSPEAVARA